MCACQLRPYFFVSVAKRCCRSSTETASSGCPIPRLLWPHPQSPAASVRVACDHPFHPRRLTAKTPACLDRCLQCVLSRALRSTVETTGQRSGAAAAPLERTSTPERRNAQGACEVLAHMENVRLGARAGVTQQTPHATPSLKSLKKAWASVPFSRPLACTLEDPPADAVLHDYVEPRPFLAASAALASIRVPQRPIPRLNISFVPGEHIFYSGHADHVVLKKILLQNNNRHFVP